MSILLVFLDGVGVGDDDPERNPFSRYPASHLAELLPLVGSKTDGSSMVRTERRTYSPIDANLGIEGLPQSGTGQATLFTGVNCAAIAGRHFGPFPHSSTRSVLAEQNVFSRVNGRPEGSSAFANAYPPRFFEVMRQRDRWPVTTRCCLEAGIHIRDLDDLAAGRALAADITGRGLADAGFAAAPVSEDVAARRLVALAREHRLTVFEYFMTDKVGHSQSFEGARAVIVSLDRFFEHLMHELLGTAITLLVTSDHGNMEDLSHRTHTRNPVPFAARGPDAARFDGVASIVDVTPTILDVMDRPAS